MHILTAAHDFYPDPGSGGTGRYVYETAREFVERGHDVSVLTRRRGEVPIAETVEGIDVYRYDVSIADESAPTIVRQLPRACRSVTERVREATVERSVDVVSFQGPLTSLFVDRAVASEIPRVLTFHSPWPAEYAIKARNDPSVSALRRRVNERLRWRSEARVVRAADRVIALSEFMSDQLEETYGRDGAAVVPGGVDADRFSPTARGSPRIDADGTSFLTVRRLSERMGLGVLIDSFARIAPEHPDVALFIAGEGPLRDELRRRAEDRGVADRVTFLGYVPDDDLPNVYAGADVFVLPTTRLEGFGLATMEALATGTPVVGTAVGGTVDILGAVRSSRALPVDPLVPSDDPDALADALSEWASCDDEALDEAGSSCREYALEHTWGEVVDEVSRVFAAATDDSRSG